MPAPQLRRLVHFLRSTLFDILWGENNLPLGAGSGGGGGGESAEVGYLRGACGALLRDLYDRSSRRPFIAQSAWLVPKADGGRVLAEVVTGGRRVVTGGRRVVGGGSDCGGVWQGFF